MIRLLSCLSRLLLCSCWLFLSIQSRGQRQIVPNLEQIAWANAEMGVIIHLDINIWAPGSFDYNDPKTLPDVNVFKPDRLDTDQWIRTAKAAGATYAILTVKHGTGFCLWPSKINPYNVGHTRWRNGQKDIVATFVNSCRKYGLKPGFYYNTNTNTYYGAGPKPFVSDSAHWVFAKAVLGQLDELWSNYGPLFEIWFDGGINADPKVGIKKPVLAMVREKQPQAILFQGPIEAGNIIRWIGNEDGIAPYPHWSRARATTAANGLLKIDSLYGDPKGNFWCPGESDVPIRRNNAWNGGWLWKANQENYLFSTGELVDKYYKSVGRNSNLLLGMVIDTSGLVPRADSMVFDSLGQIIRQLFSRPVATARNVSGKTIELVLKKPERVSQVVIQEDISRGENIRRYVVEAWVNKRWQRLVDGQSVGHKRIQTFTPVKISKLRVRIIQSEGPVSVDFLALYPPQNSDYLVH